MKTDLTPKGRLKRPGRNKKESKQKIRVYVRFTEAEHTELLGRIQTLNIRHLATYARLKTLEKDYEIEVYAKKIDLQLKAEVRKIGVNLNQIAHQLNAKFGSVNLQEFNNNLVNLDEKLKEILNILR